MVEHGDITALSIYANGLKQQGANVVHGTIRELSLVLSGANPGAMIENINIRHGDSYDTLDDEALIYTGLELEHADKTDEGADMAENTDTQSQDSSEKTVQDVFESLNEEQKNVVYFMIGQALEDSNGGSEDDEDSVQQSDNTEAIIHSINEGFDNLMSRNVFDQTDSSGTAINELSHAQIEAINNDAQKIGSCLLYTSDAADE